MNKAAKKTILVMLFILFMTLSAVFYSDYRLNLAKKDYDAKISELNLKMEAGIHALQQSMSNRIVALGSNLSSQIGLVDSSLKGYKIQNEIQINTLSSLIDQIEQQSNIKLNELKDELKNIRIKSADFSVIVGDVLQSVVSVSTNLGQGSGAVIDAKGYVVTNLHVISGASVIRVTLNSGKTYNANTVVGDDSNADIAVLKIDASDLRALIFGDSNYVNVGERVIAAGNPAGLAFTVTEGIVSAFRTGQNNIIYIQTDVPINPGNSGGPLVNTKGEIIGINNFKIGGFEGLGFAISSNDVRNAVNRIIADYESKHNQ